MARRNSGGGFGLIFFALFSAITAAYKWAQENMHIIIIAALIVAAYFIIKVRNKRKRHAAWVAYLKEKYKKDEIVDRILNREFWTGQSEDQLQDSLGQAHAIDKQVLKTKRKETWKYHEIKKGQFQLKIVLENGKVVAWDQKT
jgi:hypothetical protein